MKNTMSEADWLACTDPQRMLGQVRKTASDRKSRLFAVACCRRIWHLLTCPALQRAVEVAERFADGLVSEEDLTRAHLEAHPAAPPEEAQETTWYGLAVENGWTAARYSASRKAHEAAVFTASAVASAAEANAGDKAAWAVERQAQCCLLRHIFGNP